MGVEVVTDFLEEGSQRKPFHDLCDIWGVRDIGRRSCSTSLGSEHFGTGITSDCLRGSQT